MGYTPNFMKSDTAVRYQVRLDVPRRGLRFDIAFLAVVATLFVGLLADTLLRL